tara:strand:+ start:27 stop:1136 length:1110 start_codon:yes stop_codon:yes gene_type:complete
MSKAAELAALIGSGQAQGNKNLIINGDMKISQRGTNSGITSGATNYGPDRFKMQLNDLGTWEMSQSTTVPSGQGFSNSLKLNCTTADTSVAAGSYILLQQLIEGKNVQHLKWGTSSAKNLTWSFWIKSTKTGTFSVEFQHQNSSSTYFTRSSTFTVDSSNTWEKKSVTVPANTDQDIRDIAADGLYVTFWFTAGSNWTGGTHKTDVWSTGAAANTRVSSSVPNHADSTDNEIYLTGVQLEVGDVATAFEHEDIGTTLQKCQRYYYRIASDQYAYFASGKVLSNIPIMPITFPTAMRLTPSMTASNTKVWYNNAGSIVAVSTPTVHYSSSENDITTLDVRFADNSTVNGNSDPMAFAFDPAGYIDFSAEL